MIFVPKDKDRIFPGIWDKLQSITSVKPMGLPVSFVVGTLRARYSPVALRVFRACQVQIPWDSLNGNFTMDQGNSRRFPSYI